MTEEIKCPIVEQEKKPSQKDMVYKLFNEAIQEDGKIVAGYPLKTYITKPVKKEVRSALFFMFKNNELSYKSNKTEKNDKQLRKYCSGLISNWLSKDDRYNVVVVNE